MNDEDTIKSIEFSLGYTFRNPSLLMTALTHASYKNESKDEVEDNERLEFLGDAVIGAVVANALYLQFPAASEGELTRTKATVVSAVVLAEVARNLHLGDHIRAGKGALEGDRINATSKVLAALFEAVVGAIFLDGGFDCAREFVLHQLYPYFLQAVVPNELTDAKSALQEFCFKRFHRPPAYRVISQDGPPHAPRFTVEVIVPDGHIYQGFGRSKKEAEQAAAKLAIQEADKLL